GLAAMADVRPADRKSRQEADDRTRLAADPLQGLAVAVGHRRGAWIAVLRQPAHEAQEERELVFAGALLVNRQDETARLGLQQEVGVRDAFGDPLEAQGLAQVEIDKKLRQLVVRYVRIDRHARCPARARGPGQDTS